MCIPTFKTPTMECGTLHNEDMLCKGYQPKMLLHPLDELFYVFDQVKWQWGTDEKLVVAYEILYLSTLQCTEWQHGYEKKGMPDALSLLNVNDATISNASRGWSMMGHYWWGSSLSYPETTSGVLCWQASTSIFTGAVMMQPTAHCIH